MRPRLAAVAVGVVAVGVAAAAALQVLARDFLERQKAVALGAVIDETRFEAGLDAGDDGLVDVALALLLACGLDVEVDELLAVDDGHPKLLRLGGVEQHALHSCFPGADPAGRAAGRNGGRALARRYAIERRTTTKSTGPAAMSRGTTRRGKASRLGRPGVGRCAGEAVRSRGVGGLHALRSSGHAHGCRTIGRTIAKTSRSREPGQPEARNRR